MPRIARVAPGGIVYHVLNRGNNRQRIFHKDADARAFLDLLGEVKQRVPMRILAYCLMGNHWHLALWPYADGDLSRFMGRLATTHVRRYWLHYHQDGGAGGHLYQGRFKNFPVESDQHLLTVLRYVEANALRAGLVARAEDWEWTSLGHGLDEAKPRGLLDPWPIQRPADWVDVVNEPLAVEQLTRVRTSVARGRPFGRADWVEQLCRELGLEFTLHKRGRQPRPLTHEAEPGLTASAE